MYETVLLPTDGSDVAASSVEHAVDAATREDAVVHLLYVVDESVANAAPGLAMGEVNQELRDEGERALAELADELEAAGVETETALREGGPDEEILGYIDEFDVDLVVMGSTGKTVTERDRVGSVTDTLVRKAQVPVLSVPGE
ncbi:universal stress protein [Halorientalis litorea]|jgi:nucleotide-binding universal stress UspA family protein|uniref:universal stress protein n=1 Tax=Halorientalis litorea TaxID=2931977 RepID=UPI001FF53512|nr:universal stress protein [Halorientalis litorea]